MPVLTTLSFHGQTEAALQYYEDVLDAETLFMMRFRDSPDQSHTQPGMEDLIFHATFRVHDTVFMASDVGCQDSDSKPQFVGFSLLLQVQSAESARKVFNALADQGQVVLPLAESKFTSWYGIVVDPFGISWKINVSREVG